MHHWLLWSRFVALNMVGVAGLFLVWVNGWVNRILIADSSGISVLIFAIFLVGLIASGWRINKVTQELDNLRNGKGPLEEGGRLAAYRRALETGGSSATRALELRLFSRIAFIRHWPTCWSCWALSAPSWDSSWRWRMSMPRPPAM